MKEVPPVFFRPLFSAACRFGPVLYADDVGADAAQFFFQFFVAAVQMVDPVDDGFTFGNKAGQNQGKRSSQVGCHDLGAVQLFDAADNCRSMAVNIDVGAHPHQFGNVHEAVFKNGFGNH